MGIRWQPATNGLRPFVIGFVERIDATCAGAMLQLPFSIPVIHIALDRDRPHIALSMGSAFPITVQTPVPVRTFVIALGFGGAAIFAEDFAKPAPGAFVELTEGRSRQFAEELASAHDFAERLVIAERFVAAAIGRRSITSSGILMAADAIAQDRWSGRVIDLAMEMSLDERTLRNRFRRETGWSAKKLLSVARFNRALREPHPQPWTGRRDHGSRLEFFDDAHFHHQFVAHAGIAPARYVAAKRRFGDGLLHNVRLDGV